MLQKKCMMYYAGKETRRSCNFLNKKGQIPAQWRNTEGGLLCNPKNYQGRSEGKN
jgi:hypothetical protein